MADYNSGNTGAQIDAAVDFGQNMDGTLTIHQVKWSVPAQNNYYYTMKYASNLLL